ncbi:FCRL5 protein, partial [Anseranas semipalmata]|nr:FCRL5 protein [Anseranas semipalmata]
NGVAHVQKPQNLSPRQTLPPLPDLPPPPPPNITVTPEKTEYLIGDTISIRCMAPWSNNKMQGFRFSGTSGWVVDIRTMRRTYTYTFNITGPKDRGSHTCTYTVINKFRQLVHSQESKAIIINVKDPPTQPTLVASTSVVSEGYPLLFFCTVPARAAERRFHFYKEGVENIAGAEVTSRDEEAELRVAESRMNHTGNFTCGYEEKIEGRWILSFISQATEVFVKEPPSAPRLGLDPPFTVVSEGYPLRLTCLASSDDSRLRFRFYRNGVEIPPGQEGSESHSGNAGSSSELFFPQTPKRFSGKFSCGIEEDVGGTWVPSPQSEALDITVKGRCIP